MQINIDYMSHINFDVYCSFTHDHFEILSLLLKFEDAVECILISCDIRLLLQVNRLKSFALA